MFRVRLVSDHWLDSETDPEDDQALEGWEALAAVVLLAGIVGVALIAGVLYAVTHGLS